MANKSPFGKSYKAHSFRVTPPERNTSIRYAAADVNVNFLKAIAKTGAIAAIGGIALLSSSRSDTMQGCVDWQGVVVADTNCDTQPTPSPFAFHGGTYPYRWHYGGSSYRLGFAPQGGSFVAPSSGGFSRPNSPSYSGGTSRGLFGGWGSHYGGGWS